MQSKTTMKYHLTQVRMAITKKYTNNKCWRKYGEKKILVHCWWECNLGQPPWKTVWNFHKNIKYSEAGLLALHSKVLIIKKSTFYILLFHKMQLCYIYNTIQHPLHPTPAQTHLITFCSQSHTSP